MNLHEYAQYLAMNGEGGGSGEEQRVKNPIVHLTMSSVSTDIQNKGVNGPLLINGILQEPDNPYTLTETPITIDLLAMYISDMNVFATFVAGTSYTFETVTISDLVNCTVEQEDYSYYAIVTDSAKDASLTVVYSGNLVS